MQVSECSAFEEVMDKDYREGTYITQLAHIDYQAVPKLNADLFKLNLALSEEEFLQKMDAAVKLEKQKTNQRVKISS